MNYIIREVNYGYLLRWFHLNGASFFFFVIYLHILRGLLFHSFRLKNVWWRGTTIYLILIIIAFLGYVLPWGQISLWGATVITNLFRTIPIIGTLFVTWLWGGFRVDQPTLRCFYSLHYLLPIVLILLIVVHIMLLHHTGSTSMTIDHSFINKIKFHPFFIYKDAINLGFLFLFFSIILIAPYYLGDRENFIPANPLASPVHIKPEWYFLWAYAILRSIPNKLGGVIALVIALRFFYLLSFFVFYTPPKIDTTSLTWARFCTVIILLTWLGGNPVEYPYILLGQIITLNYFFLLSLHILLYQT